jgi:cell division protein FtsL
MATLPAYFRRTSETGLPALSDTQPERDPFQLRALPQEDVFFYCKRIDNSRLVREPDPQARGACWSAIGAACFLLVVLTSVLVPNVASTLAGYKLQALRVEERQLQAEKRTLDLQEAELVSPQRLGKLAQEQNLVTPFPGQVVHLNGKGDGAVAMVK